MSETALWVHDSLIAFLHARLVVSSRAGLHSNYAHEDLGTGWTVHHLDLP